MSKEELTIARSAIRQALDALTRAEDGLDHVEDTGIQSVTYTTRQLGVALRNIAAAADVLCREIDR